MSKGTIFYSKTNLDSCLATIILKLTLDVLDKDTEYQVINYDRSIDLVVPTEQNVIFCIGADISPIHMGELLDANPKAEIKLASYSNSEKFNKNIQARITGDLNKDAFEDGVYFKTTVTSMVYNMLHPMNKFSSVFPDVNQASFVRLMETVGKYTQYQLMTKEDVLFVYKNLDNIRNFFSDDNLTNLPFKILTPTSQDEVEYGNHVKKLREIIKRNFSQKYYTLGTGYLIAPTLGVSEESASDVMRLVSYSYDDVVTYEDRAYFRIYRIHSERNMPWFARCFKPIDIWSEGSLTFMKTSIPQQDR